MPPAIETTDLVKEYGDLRALSELSLTVEEGEFFGLLGPNGAGKTTFIETLVGLVRKTGGEARVFGYDVEDDYRQVRDSIGVAPQEFNVDRFFPIHEVLEHKAGYHGIPKAEAERRADEVLKRVGIYDKRDERFDWLSGGMKRRLLLARALVTDPDLLILDEPTAGVDVQLRRDLWDLVTDLNEEGTTVLLTTHYIEEAERLCDRVAILNEGRKVTVATPDELTARGTDTISVRLDPEPDPSLAFDRPRSTTSGSPAGATIGAGHQFGEYALEATVSGDRLDVRVDDGGAAAPALFDDLDAAGYDVLDLEISRASLEEIFVDLTAREDRTVTRSAESGSETKRSGERDAQRSGERDAKRLAGSDRSGTSDRSGSSARSAGGDPSAREETADDRDLEPEQEGMF